MEGEGPIQHIYYNGHKLIQKKAILMNLAIPFDSNIKMKEQKKLVKYQRLKEGVQKL